MRRRHLIAGSVVLALAGGLAILFWPCGRSEDAERNKRLVLADQTVRVGMTPAEVGQVLGCQPDERAVDGSVEKWTTRGHLVHTVTVEYESGRVKHVDGRTSRSKPDPSLWDDLRFRLGF